MPVCFHYVTVTATVIPGEIGSGIGAVLLTWDDTYRDDSGYDVEYIIGGTGTINASRIASGSTSYLIKNLSDNTEYQFKLVKYDADDNGVEYNSNKVTTFDRTNPVAPTFNSSMIEWTDQGPNSNNEQIVIITIPTLASDVKSIQVIAVTGVGAVSSDRADSARLYYNKGIADNQTVSYKLRAYDFNGNYTDSSTVSLVIGNRTKPSEPTIDNVTTPTVLMTQTLTGTKPTNTYLYINDAKITAVSFISTTWSYTTTLIAGVNGIKTYVKDGDNNQSDSAIVSVIQTDLNIDEIIFEKANLQTPLKYSEVPIFDNTEYEPTYGIDTEGRSVIVQAAIQVEE